MNAYSLLYIAWPVANDGNLGPSCCAGVKNHAIIAIGRSDASQTRLLFCFLRRIGEAEGDSGGDRVPTQRTVPLQRRPGISAAHPELRLRSGHEGSHLQVPGHVRCRSTDSFHRQD